MNYHKRVVQFVLITTFCIFFLSLITSVFNVQIKFLQNTSILSDVIKPKKDTATSNEKNEIISNTKTTDTAKRFALFSTPNKITAYYRDTNKVVIQNFVQKLHELKKGKRKKLRIAYLGDSMIEDDFISLTLRTQLQQVFGGYGVGFLPMSSELNGSRVTASIIASTNWKETNFRNNNSKEKLFISGRVFKADGTSFSTITDLTVKENVTLEKYLLYGNNPNKLLIDFNNQPKVFNASNTFNCLLVNNNVENKINIKISNTSPLFGVSFESPEGIIVDNFSFRGNSGQEFGYLDSNFLHSINKVHTYDLIVLQYGVNLFVQPNDKKFDWYYTPMKKSVAKLKACFSNADIILMGCADRAFRYNSNYETALGLPIIIAIQQKIAYETGVHFYNTFESMGGNGSIINWVNCKPALAYKDYMHPNAAGSALLGNSLFSAIMKEYNKTNKTTH